VAAHDRHHRSRSPAPVMTPYVTRRAVGWCCWRSPERLGGARQSLIVALVNDEGAPYKREVVGSNPAAPTQGLTQALHSMGAKRSQ